MSQAIRRAAVYLLAIALLALFGMALERAGLRGQSL